MPTSDPLVFVRYADVLLVILAAPFVILMGGPLLGYLVGGGVWIITRIAGVYMERSPSRAGTTALRGRQIVVCEVSLVRSAGSFEPTRAGTLTVAVSPSR